jgi:gamma-glutamylcyclotransferase (GGCT)/AIG2-like uncharacterized protein YtfP
LDIHALEDRLRNINNLRGRAYRLEAAWLAHQEAEIDFRYEVSQKLAVYGTLAPGHPNHDQLAGLVGTWQPCELRGRIDTRVHRVFTWDPRGAAVPAMLFTSDGLPEHWWRLDEFEGPDYRRILVPVFADGAFLTVANVYEAAVPV